MNAFGGEVLKVFDWQWSIVVFYEGRNIFELIGFGTLMSFDNSQLEKS